MSKRKPPGRPPFDPRRAKGAPTEPILFSQPPADVSPTSGALPPEAAAGARAPVAEEPLVLSVSDLTRLVRGAIKRQLPGTLYVVGQISNISRPAGGHIYLTLKDEESEVRCVMWRSDAASLKFAPADGLEVIATGEVDVYEPRGQYQFYIRRLEPRGVGALELAFRQLKAKLEREGLFDPARKRPIPAIPRRVAVVTSLTGAAIRDILQTINRRFPCITVYVYPVKVQGEGASAEIADAIRRLNAARESLGGIDVMIVGRGGGSLEDLWAFNEEAVARAIHASAIPIISAIGHEVDFTIADFVADLRAATPTAAAELVAPLLVDLIGGLDTQAHRLMRAVLGRVETCRAQLAVVERCEWFRDPLSRLGQKHQRLDETTGRLRLAMSKRLVACRTTLHDTEVRLTRVRPEVQLAQRRERLAKIEHRLRWALGHCNLMKERSLAAAELRLKASSPDRLTHTGRLLLGELDGRLTRAVARAHADRERLVSGMEARLAAGSHEAILNRGFTITRRREDGKIVRSSADAAPGDRLVTRTARGEIESRVESTPSPESTE